MPNPLLDALRYAFGNPGHTANTGLGAIAAAMKTRSLPSGYSVDEEGPRITFTGKEGTPPMAMGDILIQPPGGMSERSLAHENVHRGQSRNLGLKYLPLSLFGGNVGPLEHEAYKTTQDVGTNRDDSIADRFAIQDAEDASRNSMIQNLMYRYYYGGR